MLLSIGETARRLGINSSALRYYDERGLVRPAARRSGRRLYGHSELRRIAFIQMAGRLGIGLTVAGAVLDAPSDVWRKALRTQLAELDDLIAQAKLAHDFIRHALRCPTAHPARECTVMTGALDRLVAGESIEQLAAEHVRRKSR
jgi:DNA-binding transcriptional MerR regulator